jgi:hypothetical protein
LNQPSRAARPPGYFDPDDPFKASDFLRESTTKLGQEKLDAVTSTSG